MINNVKSAVCDPKPIITLGVPARNEAQNLPRLVSSLLHNQQIVQDRYHLQTLICINGSTDKSEEVACSLGGDPRYQDLNISVLSSDAGKMAAQQEICRQRQGEWVVFADADTELDQNCLNGLLIDAEQHPEAQVVYADTIPQWSGKLSLFDWMLSVHYQQPDVLTHRHYFQGRSFLIKCPDVFLSTMRKGEGLEKAYPRFLNLQAGPQIDDVYLSRLIFDKYGAGSMLKSPSARLNYVPPRSMADYYRGMKRLLIEIHRLDILYPEHAHLQRDYFQRRTILKRWAGLTASTQLRHMGYKSFDHVVRGIVKMQIAKGYLFPNSETELWPETRTTKSFEQEDKEV
ncbi:MAG: glycosyltransferase family 2 protein [Pseudomonadaceae bacterium]|nr:glycosyltransferase family 2 protein [Pseudomonadaceae bacterium]